MVGALGPPMSPARPPALLPSPGGNNQEWPELSCIVQGFSHEMVVPKGRRDGLAASWGEGMVSHPLR